MEGLAACIDERLDGCSFIDFSRLELSVNREMKMPVNRFFPLTIQDAQRAKLLYGSLG